MLIKNVMRVITLLWIWDNFWLILCLLIISSQKNYNFLHCHGRYHYIYSETVKSIASLSSSLVLYQFCRSLASNTPFLSVFRRIHYLCTRSLHNIGKGGGRFLKAGGKIFVHQLKEGGTRGFVLATRGVEWRGRVSKLYHLRIWGGGGDFSMFYNMIELLNC